MSWAKLKFNFYMSRSTVHPAILDDVQPYIERDELVGIHMLPSFSDWRTHVVTGPRGSGKSVAVHTAFIGHKRTVIASFKSSVENFARDVLSNVNVNVKFIPGTSPASCVLESALRQLSEPPTIIVEVDSTVEPQALEELLVWLKIMCHDQQLARFVVVLSVSQVLSGVRITPEELRCRLLAVGDLNNYQVKEYLTKSFKHLLDKGISESDVSELVERNAAKVGKRLLHLRELHLKLKSSKTIKDADNIIEKFALQRLVLCYTGIQRYIADYSVDAKT